MPVAVRLVAESAEVETRSPEPVAFVAETLLNVNHIRDGNSGYGRGLLSQEQSARIDELMRKWDLNK